MQHFHTTARYSDAVVANGFVFLAGQVPRNPEACAGDQTADVLQQIDELLAECGSDKSRICEVVIYLADMADYATMNAVWDAWVAGVKAPPRACVQAALADASWKVEIKLTALKNNI